MFGFTKRSDGLGLREGEKEEQHERAQVKRKRRKRSRKKSLFVFLQVLQVASNGQKAPSTKTSSVLIV